MTHTQTTGAQAGHTAPSASHGAETQLFTRCGDWLFAIDTRHIEHIQLCADLQLLEPETPPHHPAFLGLLTRHNQKVPAWNLGRMLDLDSTLVSWVFVRVNDKIGSQLLALGTGPCTKVGKLSSDLTTVLPAGISIGRKRVITAAFDCEIAGEKEPGGLGLCLNVQNLWQPDELKFSDERRGADQMTVN